MLIVAIVAVIGLGARRRRRARTAGVAVAATAAEAAVPGTRPRPPLWEVLFDVAWVVGLAAYVYGARRYPSPADIAPLYLGIAALVVALFQLLGVFVPGLRRVTHGDPAAPGMHMIPLPRPAAPDVAASGEAGAGELRPPAPEPAPAGAAMTEMVTTVTASRAPAGPAVAEPAAVEPIVVEEPAAGRGESLRQLAAVALAAALVGGVYLFGYTLTVPLWTFLYFAAVRRWKLRASVVAAAAMLGAFYLASRLLTSVLFPHGIL